MHEDKFRDYQRGSRLIGDDFSASQINEWFEDEKEGYANLGAKNREDYDYPYHMLNTLHGFSVLPNFDSCKLLGVGSAYGDELYPILSGVAEVTILDPSKHFEIKELDGVPVHYIQPVQSGKMPFHDDAFDLITCLGVLHHIPNVTYVISEIHRTLKPGGFALIREPVVNMGDWRKPRQGLTKRERGIPVPLMKEAIAKAKLNVVKQVPCMFPLVAKLASAVGFRQPYNSKPLCIMDAMLSKATEWNWTYDRVTLWRKFCPTNYFWVCQKSDME